MTSLREQRGFTLIELLVVMLVLGILAAIALPAFLDEREKAQDGDAKSNAGNLRVHIEACAADDKPYTDCDTAAELEATGLPIAGIFLPPDNQFAQTGAECKFEGKKNEDKKCTDAGAGGGGGGTTTTDTGTTTTGTTTTGTTTTGTSTTGTEATTTDTGTTGTPSADGTGIGYCRDASGDVSEGCVGVVGGSNGYVITAVSKSGNTFVIRRDGGTVERTCSPAGEGGCYQGGRW